MKKFVALGAAAAMCLTMSISAFAATGADPIEGSSTTFTYEHKNDPTYTVTVPAAVTLTDEGTPMNFTASDVRYLDGKKISVSILETDYYRNQMVLNKVKTEEDDSQGSMRYQLVLEDDTVVETTGGKDQVVGVELVSFTEDGTKTITARPADNSGSSSFKIGSYTGIMNYSIALADAE